MSVFAVDDTSTTDYIGLSPVLVLIRLTKTRSSEGRRGPSHQQVSQADCGS